MTKREEIISKLNELKPWLQKEYSVREIGLFGSFADNTQTDESDIDILVELENLLAGGFLRWNFILKRFLTGKLTW